MSQLFRWDAHTTFKFISLYKSNPCLYDTKHPDYKNRMERQMAINDMVEDMEIPYFFNVQCKGKIKNIRSAYCQDLKKIKIAERGGYVYTPSCAWFKFVDEFLRAHVISSTPVMYQESTKDSLGEITIKKETMEETIIDESSPDHQIENYADFTDGDNYMVDPIEIEEEMVEVYEPWDNDEVEIIPVDSPKTVDLTDTEQENRQKSPVPTKSKTPPLPEPEKEKAIQVKRKAEDRPSKNPKNQNNRTESPVSKKSKISEPSTSIIQQESVQSQTDAADCFEESSTVIDKIKRSETPKTLKKTDSNTDFQAFGMFVADQLQRIPINRALRAQLTITTILTELRVLSAEENTAQMNDDK